MAKILNAPKTRSDWPRNISAEELDGKRIPADWSWPPPADAHLVVPIKHRFLRRLVWWARDTRDGDRHCHHDRLLPAELDLFELVAHALRRFLIDRRIESSRMGAVSPIDTGFSVDLAAEQGSCGSLKSVGRRAAMCLAVPITLSAATGQDLARAAQAWFEDAGEKTPDEVVVEAIWPATKDNRRRELDEAGK